MKSSIKVVTKKDAFEMARLFFGNDQFVYLDVGEIFSVYLFTFDTLKLVIEKFYNTKWTKYPFGKVAVNDKAAGSVEFIDYKPTKTYLQKM